MTKKEFEQKIYDLNFSAANAKEKVVYLYEKSSLDRLIGLEKAEELRALYVKNEIVVKEIMNHKKLWEFSKNESFTNNVMAFRSVSEEVINIQKEIFIFDDTVAVYSTEGEPFIEVIQDKNYADMQKSLFLTVWDAYGQKPGLEFNYEPNHSYCNSIDYLINDTQVIIWPEVAAKETYSDLGQVELGLYIKDILDGHSAHYKGASYIIAFLWSFEGKKMTDIWKFDSNFVDDKSGPLSEARIYRNGVDCTDLGLASGNTLLILGYEEKLRRQAVGLSEYLSGPIPNIPLEICNGKDFFGREVTPELFKEIYPIGPAKVN